MSSPKFKGFFRPKSEIQGFVSGRNQKLKVFFGRMQVISKKEKGLHRNSKGFFRPKSETQGVFLAEAGDLQQRKVFPEIQRVFPAEIR